MIPEHHPLQSLFQELVGYLAHRLAEFCDAEQLKMVLALHIAASMQTPVTYVVISATNICSFRNN
jgi:hypothetical protein